MSLSLTEAEADRSKAEVDELMVHLMEENNLVDENLTALWNISLANGPREATLAPRTSAAKKTL